MLKISLCYYNIIKSIFKCLGSKNNVKRIG
nr:MAG TPA: hypothetical protein [Caudoviricetes sp.]